MFDAIKNDSKFRGIQFEKVDLDKNAALAEKYHVESIPFMVILSDNGSVLYGNNPPMERAEVEKLINKF